jgi:hypothetical protein
LKTGEINLPLIIALFVKPTTATYASEHICGTDNNTLLRDLGSIEQQPSTSTDARSRHHPGGEEEEIEI